jgi:hypothetical protein
MYQLVLFAYYLLGILIKCQPTDGIGPASFRMKSLDYSKIFCDGDLPKNPFGQFGNGWTPQERLWSQLNFTSVVDLCSAYGNPKGNMGGVVSSDNLSESVMLADRHVML